MVLLVQHAFQDLSGLSEDRYVNTFHMVPSVLGGGTHADAATCFKDFYDKTNTSGQKLKAYLAEHVFGANASVKMWDLDDAIPRNPVYEEFYNPTSAGFTTTALPGEVASCLSFQAPPQSGVSMARLRGRIYIGPLNTTAVAVGGATAKSRPDSSFQNAAVAAFQDLAVELTSSGWLLVQYSPTTESFHAIEQCWMDNAWDTQRRRGVDPTGRISGPVI